MITPNEARSLVNSFNNKKQELFNKNFIKYNAKILRLMDETIRLEASQGRSRYSVEDLTHYVWAGFLFVHFDYGMLFEKLREEATKAGFQITRNEKDNILYLNW